MRGSRIAAAAVSSHESASRLRGDDALPDVSGACSGVGAFVSLSVRRGPWIPGDCL